jgi:predicted MFS family arabinose efflux permease
MSAVKPFETRAVLSLAALYIVRMLGLFMVLPVLILSGADYTHSNVFLLGVALGIYGLTQACLQIPFGILSDRFGRKRLIIIGLIIFALGSVLAATAESIQGVIVGRALQGAGAIAGVIMAMVGDMTSNETRTKAMATIGASIGVAFALSLVVGPLLAAAGGVRWVFWLTLALSIIAIAIVIWIVPPENQSNRHRLVSLDGLRQVTANIDLLRLNLGIFTLHAVLMSLFVALPLFLQTINIPPAQHAWVYLGVMGISFVLMVPLIILGERRDAVKHIFLSLLLIAALALLSLAFISMWADIQSTTSAILILVGILCFFIGFNYLEATLPSLMSKTVADAHRGAGSSVFSTCQFLGAAVGGILGGWLFNRFGIAGLMFFCATALFAWWLIACNMNMPKQAQNKVDVDNVLV